MEEFRVESKALEGANIIEASAGTGKTFSIAVLVVRLLVKKNIPIEKMLLVTFTDAAAAELKERSIRFIREALQELEKEASSENKIIELVIKNAINDGIKKEDIIIRLRAALLNIDESKMCTIHSFCQQTLNEYAFETNQIFGKELKTDISDSVLKHTNAYRREVLNKMDEELFDFSELSDSKILDGAVKSALSGQKLHGTIAGINSLDELQTQFDVLQHKIIESNQALLDYVESKIDELKKRVDESPKKGLRRNDIKGFLATTELAIFNLQTRVNYNFPELFPLEIEHCKSILQEIDSCKRELQIKCIQNAIDYILPKVRQELQEKNYFTFDDLINQLYAARESEALKKVLSEKYKAVFVDEFQDTDKKQYAIFRELFQDNQYGKPIMFYIGDPKQSIYAWRKADLKTYIEARNSIPEENRFTMKKNFRSTSSLIKALNYFFYPTDDFDTFENGDIEDDEKIKYEKVGSDKNKSGISKGNESIAPITIVNGHSDDEDVELSILNIIRFLFDGNALIDGTAIKPSQVALLVRKNSEAKTVKRILDKEKIPSVVLDDSKIVESDEAKELIFLLKAMLNSKKSSIQKALLTTFIGKRAADLESVNFDEYVNQFIGYQKKWQASGVYVALSQLIQDYGIIDRFQKDTTTGHRVLSNLRQLIELLQEKEQNDSLTPNELYVYLNNQTKSKDEGSDSENKELAQRIESDEDAVKIVTIHKSKGMEYDIVIAPYLDLEAKEKFEYSSVRINENGTNDYVFTRNPIVDPLLKKQFIEQQKQENRRLLYVALTRAKYNVFILDKNGEHSLRNFVDTITLCPHEKIEIKIKDDISDWANLSVNIQTSSGVSRLKEIPSISFTDANFKKMSYSFLAAHPAKVVKENRDQEIADGYENFVFKELKKGATIGNLLHNIFEFIDYTSADNWEGVIKSSVQSFAPSLSDDSMFSDRLKELVQHTLNAPLRTSETSFTLSQIAREKRVNELEFNFKIPEEFKMINLEYILGEDQKILTHRAGEVYGMMNGLIDLFVEHEGRYYILDWKSNYLGDALEDYASDKLTVAMNESNYHLQYLIYCVAVRKYLVSRKLDFDYEQHFGGVYYLFLRGVRAQKDSGIYHFRPSLDQLDKMEEILKINKDKSPK
jgi:exodeoxyribonuclease V beta subunit